MRWLTVSIVLVSLILVPFFLFEDYFNRLAERIVAGEGPTWSAALAVAGLLASDCLLPIPSSIVSAAAGVMLGFWPGTSVVWIGMSISCVIGYVIGVRSASGTKRFVGGEGFSRAAALSERYGSLAIVLCRPVPVLAEASVIFAGVMRVPPPRFFAVCALANLGVAMGYAAIGAFSMSMDSFLLAFFLSLAIPGIGMLIARRAMRRQS
jgi:uncharacterized membrane protein YdjX (TVP38/TMEM64 family)